MGDIVDLARVREDRGLWSTSELLCLVCAHEWPAVYPVPLPNPRIGFECPECHFMAGALAPEIADFLATAPPEAFQ